MNPSTTKPPAARGAVCSPETAIGLGFLSVLSLAVLAVYVWGILSEHQQMNISQVVLLILTN